MTEMITKLCKGCDQVKPCWKTRSTYCMDCCKKHNRDWEARHKTGVKERDRLKNQRPEVKRQISTRRKIKRRADPAFREREIVAGFETRLARMGLTLEQYDTMHVAQSGLCAICRRPSRRKQLGRLCRLAVDHNHVTKRIRELLCAHCNTGLGLFGESTEFLQAAVFYLLKHRGASSVEV